MPETFGKMRWKCEPLEGGRIRVSADLTEAQSKKFFEAMLQLEKLLTVRAQLEGLRMVLDE